MPNRSINKFVRAPLVCLAIVEFGGLIGSYYIANAVLFREGLVTADAGASFFPSPIVFSIVMIVVMIAMGLYHLNDRMTYKAVLARVIVSMLLGEVALLILHGMVASLESVQHSIATLVVAIPYLAVVRFSFGRNFDDNIFRYRTLVYGAGQRAESLRSLRRRADRRGFLIVGHIAAPTDVLTLSKKLLQLNGKSIAEVALSERADEIVVAVDNRRGNLPVRELLDCKLRGIDVIDIVEFLERESGKIRVDLVQPGWMVFSSGFQCGRVKTFAKRTLDIVVSLATLLVAWPLMVLVILAIKLEDGFSQPVLYRQQRVGMFGKTFSLLKFRSMTVNAESDGVAVWASKNDKRVTKVGRIIRLSRLDELPQVFNILQGHMSIVGPRPERPEFVTELAEQIPYYSERHTIKPGLTGWAQLRYSYGSSMDDSIEKLQYDLYYVKNQSLLLDLMIMLQTLEVILWSKGAR